MNKDFSKDILISFTLEKQLKILYDLASFIEEYHHDTTSSHFQKLKKYHQYLSESNSEVIEKLNKELNKVDKMDYQFQVYLMNLERLLGQSKKEYQFITTKDSKAINRAKFPIICLLDSVRSAHNVGAMIRNAECFGIEKLYMTGLSPNAENQHVIKTAMGAQKYTKCEFIKEATAVTSELKSQGYTIWAIETAKNSTKLSQIKKRPQKLAIIFGHEQFGISNELILLCDLVVSIELHGVKNSLNVAVSQGIVLNQLINDIEISDS